MKHLFKSIGIGLASLSILCSCDNNIGGTPNNMGSSSINNVAAPQAASLTVQLNSNYGSISSTESSDIPVYPSIVLSFSKPIDASTITSADIGLYTSSGTQVATTEFTYSDNKQAIIFSPASELKTNSGYYVSVTTNVKAADGSNLDEQFMSTFTTESDKTKHSSVALLKPYGDNISAKSIESLQIILAESGMTNVSPTFIVLRMSDCKTSIKTTGSIKGRIYAMTLPKDYSLNESATYCITVADDIADANGYHIHTNSGTYPNSTQQFKFTTASSGGYFSQRETNALKNTDRSVDTLEPQNIDADINYKDAVTNSSTRKKPLPSTTP